MNLGKKICPHCQTTLNCYPKEMKEGEFVCERCGSTIILENEETYISTSMIHPSEEQKAICEKIKSGHSVKVDAVAGSGKTYTVLLLAQASPEKKILQITYNALLKTEVRKTKEKMGLDNLAIHNYHSLILSYYGFPTYDDLSLVKFLDNRIARLKRQTPKFDIIVIDELQDMTALYYEIIWRFIDDLCKWSSKKIQLLLVGDENQAIYNFKDADPRYLTFSSEIWPSHFNQVDMPLRTSFRLTNQMAAFFNDVMLEEERIFTQKEGQKVDYVICDAFDSEAVLSLIEDDLKSGKINPDDIFILGGSIKSDKSPIRKLENLIVKKSKDNVFGRPVPVYCTFDEERKLKDEIIRKKIVFSTFHQAKGRERPIVIVYGFDNSYFKYYCREKPVDRCPSELYVACSRASNRLILVHHYTHAPLPFLQMDFGYDAGRPYKLHQFHYLMENSGDPGTDYDQRSKSVTDLVKYLSLSIMERVAERIEPIIRRHIRYQKKSFKKVKTPGVITLNDNLLEEVSNINGIAIPAMFEAKTSTKKTAQIFTVLNEIKQYNKKAENAAKEIVSIVDPAFIETPFIQKAIATIPEKLTTIDDYLYASIVYHGVTSELFHKIHQINKFGWLTQQMVDDCHDNMEQVVAAEATFEIPILYMYKRDNHQLHISGIMDADDGNTIWEFKCVDSLTLDHYLQLAIYAYMWHHVKEDTEGNREFKLFNIRTGELWEFLPDKRLWEILEEIVSILAERVFNTNPKISDSEFLTLCRKIRMKYNFSPPY